MIEIEIKKPLYGNYVYIRESILNKAIRSGNQLLVIVPKGKAVVNPTEWKRKGQRMSKVFLRPDEPMILYGGNVPIELPKVEPLVKQGKLL